MRHVRVDFSHPLQGWDGFGVNIRRARRPGLHSWVTSTGWSNMDVLFVDEIRNLIYMTEVNAIISWACIQREGKWIGGDPNPGCAFRSFSAFRTSPQKEYVSLGAWPVRDGVLPYDAPPQSVTTFYGD